MEESKYISPCYYGGPFLVTSSLEAQHNWSEYMIMEGPWTEDFPNSVFEEDLAWVNRIFLGLSYFGFNSPSAAYGRSSLPSQMMWAQAITDL